MQEISLATAASAILFVSLIVLLAVLFLYANVMNLLLRKRLDPVLFREPFFSSAEISMFSAWPLSLIKVGHYMFLITFPGRSRRKRFIGLEQSLNIGKPIQRASNLYIYVCILYFVAFILFILIGGSLYFF